MNATCVTVSGPPQALADFSSKFAVGPVLKTTVDTLYHAPAHVSTLRSEVLADVESRKINFPTTSGIKVPLRSTYTGDLITSTTTGGPLVELVVDMLVTQPVNWDLVMSKLADAILPDAPVRLLNLGPSSGLLRNTERALEKKCANNLDLTSPTAADGTLNSSPKPKQDPIAIVGMAVNVPGAPSASKLWELLENGINTISEVYSS